jgi:hypothetical protein
MKKYFVLLLFFATFWSFSQEKFSKEISFVNDNDLYVSVVRDRYYTNGMFLNYIYLSENKKESLEKKIFQWQIGHKMFTPHKAVVTSISEHDRPFAGYLYGNFGITNVYKANKILTTSLEIGVIGENAFGKELQDFIHSIYGFKKAVGWEYQIKNALGVGFGAEYISLIGKDSSGFYDISWVNTANLGTVFTDISSGFYGRIGFKPLQKLANSIAFKTNLNDENTNDVREIESFLFIKPTVRYAFYDATIQGSFLNTGSEVTKELIPVVFNIEIGLKFTANRFHFAYVFNYNTSKSEGLKYTYGNKFGTVAVHYLLH